MATSLRAAILAAADAIEAAREPLCALDAATGDGDHGLTMAIGARGVRRQLERVDGDDPAGLVRAAASGMGSAGGAIGPIYARGLAAVAEVLDSPTSGAATAEGIAPPDPVTLSARALEAAARAIVVLGGAAPGDKTILDALVPCQDSLERAGATGIDLGAAATAAAAAALAGADATAGMEARIGRSARFAQRSIGTADPGATSFAIIAETIAAAVAD
jgi:dihydroxyacetone kinase